jgi:hypothetical protein
MKYKNTTRSWFAWYPVTAYDWQAQTYCKVWLESVEAVPRFYRDSCWNEYYVNTDFKP